MSSLEAPGKEELLQELLAFKHIEHFPASFEDLPFRVSEITDKCIHLRQLYDNTVERRKLTYKYIDDLEEMEMQLQLENKLSSKLQSDDGSIASQEEGYDKMA